MRKKIDEKDNEQKDWYEKTKCVSLKELPEFLRHLSEDYKHDYGTICHALTAGAIATMWALNKTEQGGITGFQASCIMWEFIKNWMHYENPMKLVDFGDMLYPQYGKKFEKTISRETWEWLQKQAVENLKTESACESVRNHWQSIANGIIPFDYVVAED